MDLEKERPRRRHGQELEDAILDAAWSQLAETGYAGLTFEGVAERANTSRPVIYRRWRDRDELASAAITRFFARQSVPELPDTGSLRSDLLELMRRANDNRAAMIPLLVTVISSYHAETGHSFAELRERAFGERSRNSISEIFDRAVARGEVDPKRLTPRVRDVAFDLFRHDLLMTLRPLSEANMVAIIDEVVLPLVR
ncbi:TetR/AcrR family transcriptional regulator [Gordonia sp. TBRC 11910]|uniref:TetR/AcrR family transcriptional regulator n=1 Tax=Gordonia asplenii TaxID=2725283 RepID=A0A848L0U2_9ACTN|nr:TetR/AcrR family transcriptional regulator [Gordonia asplenii]NMO02121.1 TetR/AcrR family transcriptional regulator [Gordonia asplenii]